MCVCICAQASMKHVTRFISCAVRVFVVPYICTITSSGIQSSTERNFFWQIMWRSQWQPRQTWFLLNYDEKIVWNAKKIFPAIYVSCNRWMHPCFGLYFQFEIQSKRIKLMHILRKTNQVTELETHKLTMWVSHDGFFDTRILSSLVILYVLEKILCFHCTKMIPRNAVSWYVFLYESIWCPT